MSAANLRLEIIRPPMEIVDLKLCNVSLMMFCKYKLKRIGERRRLKVHITKHIPFITIHCNQLYNLPKSHQVALTWLGNIRI